MTHAVRARALVALLTGAFAYVAGAAAAPRPAADVEANFARAWKSVRGSPYREIPVQPPVFKNHPRFARGYSGSIIDFAFRIFHNQETNFYALANAKIAENCRFYIENTDVRDDRDSFYWHIGTLCRTVLHYGRRGDVRPGLLAPETERVFNDMAFGYCHDMSKYSDADPDQTWHVYESGNHHVQRASAFWQLMHVLLKDDPAWGERKLGDGRLLREHYARWGAFFGAWMRERAKRSMFIEVQSRSYGTSTMKCIYPIHDFADDPELRRVARDFIDLYWALWAQEQIDGSAGGGMTRIYPGVARRTMYGNVKWAYWYFGIGVGGRPSGDDFVVLDSSYRPAPIIGEIARSAKARGVYEIESRPIGWALPENSFPEYRPDSEWGRIYRYTYATPDFIVGTLMTYEAPMTNWCAISSQNRYQGVVFGPRDAQVVPLPEPMGRQGLGKKPPSASYNGYVSMQRRGTLVTRRCRFAAASGNMRVWFSEAGGVDRVEEDGGWYFTRCGGALCAVKAAKGDVRLVRAGKGREVDCDRNGSFLVCSVRDTPVVVETARLRDFGSEAAFRAKVKSLPMKLGAKSFEYVGLYGNVFKMDLDANERGTVDGEPCVKEIDWSFNSPFVRSRWKDGRVVISFQGRERVLDFKGK